MILTSGDIIKYIPFSALTRTQVAELLGKSPRAIDSYVSKGKKIMEGHIVYLKKEANGTFKTSAVLNFFEQIKKEI